MENVGIASSYAAQQPKGAFSNPAFFAVDFIRIAELLCSRSNPIIYLQADAEPD
jgi:hypothetical protein